ncbi:murein transglycosylase [Vibrio inusitatus NBRC 102082]|uniref:Murein transglycosylase n=1 Tax=Vibrio inusitatus NBRC 102082 TaxID=1219070 RepID=A0A4Y3HYS4_9VIBR|nr:DUF1254 domain-containing protein [Vibrio inusitatus]GEA52286.1 murein transglycosylase [Vibrio inusitatus NBRC 102082]
MKKLTLAFAITISLASSTIIASDMETQHFIPVTESNFAHAETARMYRNWMAGGANEQFAILKDLPPRGDKAPTVQMNDDTLYGVAILKAVDGKVTFQIPKTDNYLSVQVITENGHGEHLIVEDGVHTVSVTDTNTAFLIYRSGLENGIDESRKALYAVDTSVFNFATDYKLPKYDFDEVDQEVWKRKRVVDGIVEETGKFTYTFPRTPSEVTDLRQWNLENAAGWGGASPIANEGNKYVNSPFISSEKCVTTTFTDPKNTFFTSVTAYDSEKYLIEGAVAPISYTWDKNEDGTVTISFNCGADAINNVDTSAYDGDFTITTRHYGATQEVIDSEYDLIIKELEEEGDFFTNLFN